MVTVVQKALMGQSRTMPKTASTGGFFAGKATACASTLILRLMQSATIMCKNPMRKRVKFAWLKEHHLRREIREEQAISYLVSCKVAGTLEVKQHPLNQPYRKSRALLESEISRASSRYP